MGIVSGSRIVEDGLVFHYDMENTSKSFRGKPVTNLVASGQRTCSSGLQRMSAHVQSWTYSVNQQYAGRKDTIRMYINPTTSNPYSDFGFQVSKSGGSVIGDVYWVSFEYKTVKGNSDPSGLTTYANGYKNPDSSSAHTLSDVSITTLPDGWKRWSGKATITQAGNTWWRFGQNSNSFETETYLDNFQIILSDTDAPFVDGTRSNTEALIDLTSNETITANSLTYNNDGTFEFVGSSQNYIQVPLTNLGADRNNFSIEVWADFNVSGNSQVLFNAKGQSLYPRIWKNGSNQIQFQYRQAGTTQNMGPNSSTAVSLNTPYHIVMTFDSSSGSKGYFQGIHKVSNTTTGTHDGGTSGSMTIGRDTNLNYYGNGKIYTVRMYNSTLSDAEVKQNFEASRSRYGV